MVLVSWYIFFSKVHTDGIRVRKTPLKKLVRMNRVPANEEVIYATGSQAHTKPKMVRP